MQPTEVTAEEQNLQRLDSTPTQQNNENDTLYIRNPDIGCLDITYDSVRVSERFRDPESGRILTRFPDVSYTFEHKDGFQVRWSGRAFNIPPGETRKMPRFLGEHFALHLANHLLDKEGEKMNRSLRADPIWRPRILKEIIVGEESFFSGTDDSVGTALAKQFEDMNADVPGAPKGQNLKEGDATPKGTVVATTGNISTSSVEPTADVIARLGTETEQDKLNVPEDFAQYSKAELIQQIRNIVPDYKFGTSYTKAQLVGVLKKEAV